MDLGTAFWVVFLVCLLVGGWSTWGNPRGMGVGFGVGLLLFILGWAQFGPPIHGQTRKRLRDFSRSRHAVPDVTENSTRMNGSLVHGAYPAVCPAAVTQCPSQDSNLQLWSR